MRLMDVSGAHRVSLVGRHDLLAEAQRRIGRGGVHLLHFEGVGGIGKTALLDAVLDKSRRGGKNGVVQGCCIANKAIDLGQPQNYTAVGLIGKITQVLGEWFFEGTQEVLEALNEARLVGDMDTAKRRADALQITFLEEFLALTEDGIVLAFDALEVLDSENGPFREALGAEMPVPSAGDWLLDAFFPALRGNVVVLLAGRPSSMRLRLEKLSETFPRLLLSHSALGPFEKEETIQYLSALAHAEGRDGHAEGAARLWAFSQEQGGVVHVLTGGRPLLLALVGDMIARGWDLPDRFFESLESVKKEGMGAGETKVEKVLLDCLLKAPAPFGETLRALAWLRRGANPELLARVMDLRTLDGAWDIYTATGYLNQVVQLSVVRVGPATRRVFLHDELYTLLEDYVLHECDHEERDAVYRRIRNYFVEKCRDLERHIEPAPPILASNQVQLRRVLTEEMHYRLWHDPHLGFAMYFWLAEEALGGRDAEMDVLVHTEFLRTFSLLTERGRFLGFLPFEVKVDNAVRWGMRMLFLRQDVEKALDIFDRVQRRWGKDVGKLGLAWVHLRLYQAVARVLRADRDDWLGSRQSLVDIENDVDEVLGNPPENSVVKARRWRAKVLKSIAANYRGYLARQQGRHLEAVKHYQQSAMLQRRLAMAGLAPTLINLAYAMALLGADQPARLLAEEAKQLARRRGRGYLLGLALNVRAWVEVYDDHPKAAQRYADRALEVATELPAPRVQGLIRITRARVNRHLWDTLAPEEEKSNPSLLQEALREASLAVSLLRNSPTDTVDALLERGRVYGELARAACERADSAGAEKYATSGRQDLDRCVVLAGAMALPYQQALAWTHLAWLHYSLGETEQMQEALEQVDCHVPPEYVFPSEGGIPAMVQSNRREEAILPYWRILGRAEMVRACLALDRAWTAEGEQEHVANLEVAVGHLTHSLAYHEFVATKHFDLTRSERELHQNIIQRDFSIRALHQAAQKVAERQDLPQPTRFQAFLNQMFGMADLWY